ncbi:hypothetical protein SAMN04488698_11955 [Candidatus Frackibacter sp. WG12]|nr:MAG: hypothetical protein AWU54_1727 [Candidatus Frackibacter sp. T328-2]SDC67993.1 hypothetical protein SAMN04515661_1198 [Candidatus Frackibacter sp. WG11]SEM83649.1 hypothetical protein SAMN04488698_11955 [Candidatus Frackibacter sp. WG12]SFL91613.1 hypothetical protein SAMN04488699_1208 [Candidatus Frackibacter sp. WG13]
MSLINDCLHKICAKCSNYNKDITKKLYSLLIELVDNKSYNNIKKIKTIDKK